jgi:6-phosphofructokinase 1
VKKALQEGEFELAATLRGRSFVDAFQTLRTLVRAEPHKRGPEQPGLRIAVLNAGAPAPGMNTAVRSAVRLGLDAGHTMIGVRNGFTGLIENELFEMNWMTVNGWANRGGSELGTNRRVPVDSDFYAVARTLELNRVQAILLIGGWSGYQGALELYQRRNQFPAFDIPVLCLPATIDNDLPGSELSVGADTALNSIVWAVDKIKQSAVASGRVFVVEVMGGKCGYLALMGALATGAERVYLHEEGVTLEDLVHDVNMLVAGFSQGKRLGLMIRNEMVNPTYDTRFMAALFEEEGGDLFEVRQAILGHIQQGGSPTPFDRNFASRLAADCIDLFTRFAAGEEESLSCVAGLLQRNYTFTPLEDVPRLMNRKDRRPLDQWWMALRPLARILAQPGPSARAVQEEVETAG